jgi:hypothetical protein
MKSLQHAHTRSIAVAASPATVLAYLSDYRNLPHWAPSFAPSIRERDGQLLVRREDGGEFAIRLEVSTERGTVDIVSAVDPRRGAFTRVIPNGEGSEYVFTLFFDPSTEPEAIAAQMMVVDDELAAVRDVCELWCNAHATPVATQVS